MLFNFSYRNIYDNIELNLYTCGYDICKSGHSYGPAVRSGYLIHIILSGKGIYRGNNQEHQLKAGDGFLIYPDELIYYEADQDEPWEYIWVGFTGTKVNDYLRYSTLTKENPTFTLQKNSQLYSAIHDIIEATKLNSNKNLKIISTLYQFLYILLEEFPKQVDEIKITPKMYVEEALAYIQSHYQEDLSVQKIAEHLAIDRSYFHRMFKKYTKLSPQEYILNFKIEKAVVLLTTTDLKIGDIARSVGYPNTLLFSKTFKKIKKETPTNYRTLHKK